MAKTWEIVLIVVIGIGFLIGLGFLIYYLVHESSKPTVNPANVAVCSSTPVTAPTNVLASLTKNKSINVSWMLVPDIDSYNIYIDTNINFQANKSNFVKNVANTVSSLIIGPYDYNTYYVKVASIKGNCRSDGTPASGAKVVVSNNPIVSTKVRLRLNKEAYNISGCNFNFFSDTYYIERTNNGCVNSSVTGGRADFGLATDSAADLDFIISDPSSTFIQLASDPTKYLGVTIIGGNNHPCIEDASVFTDSSKFTWTYNPSTGTLGLVDGSAILIGNVSTDGFTIHHLYGPYVASSSDGLAQCFPSSTCNYNKTCSDPNEPSIIYVKWILEPVTT